MKKQIQLASIGLVALGALWFYLHTQSGALWPSAALGLLGLILAYLSQFYSAEAEGASLPKVKPVEGFCLGCFALPVLLFSAWFGWIRWNPPAAAPAGNWVIIATPALAPVNQAAANEMYALIRSKDVNGVQRLAAQGKVLVLQKGTRMVLQSSGMAQHAMTVLDGPSAGRSCLVATEQVSHE